MKKNKKNIIPTLKEITDYIYKRMGPAKRHDFEREMQKNPFLEDAVEGLSMADEKRVTQDIAGLKRRIIGSKKSYKRKYLMAFAAGLGILIITSVTLVTLQYIRQSTDSMRLGREEIPAPVLPEPYLEEDTASEPESRTEEEFLQIEELPESPASTLKETGTYQSAPAEIAGSKVPGVVITVKDDNLIADFDFPVDSPIIVAEEAPLLPQQNLMIIRSTAPASKASLPGQTLVKGTVIDISDGSPLPGVTIVISGTSRGVVSDINGNFEIWIPEGEKTKLVASFIGMVSEEFYPENLENNTLAMSPDMATFDEVVVIGYGARSRQSSIIDDDYRKHSDYRAPEPVSGYREYNRYLRENAVLPEDSETSRAVVVLKFEINTQGRPQNIQVVRSPGQTFTKIAERIILDGPDWHPARTGDRQLTEEVQIRIVLR